ncbi:MULTISPECIES: 3-keto-5-aminohexanoate cleavage protein [Mesorhizobium]|uniref:3-keto-5-aminohexanoate cleavage protein n=1 Tax=Mesorhizobium TaxID=68287 RepID=UPI0007EDB5BE|nr:MULTISPECIES: 3-keto-5-aminohexanoate cleavage protein [Mesorhizobium]PBB51849.1 3-keto-5-aminohexanoate cleavage protein [Mesorhizobium loti]QIA25303.1 3-keto-5-aminohexanoate cleavage protein [Mesorhizobium sp. AA22]
MCDVEQPTAICVAPNGGRLSKADHPAIPLGTFELARTAQECLDAGACLIHVHVRDQDGGHLLDASAYREVMQAIGEVVGDEMIVQVTSEALGRYTPEQQIAVIKETRPQAVSLALRELVPTQAHESGFASLLSWICAEEILPQVILYDPDETFRLSEYHRRGLIPWNDVPVLFVLGRYTPGQKSRPADLLPFIDAAKPRFAHWSVCAFGERETACVTAAALLGGHIRVGFENNRRLADGKLAESNAELVVGVAKALQQVGLRSAGAAELRQAWQDL